jgi:hypothetical protein
VAAQGVERGSRARFVPLRRDYQLVYELYGLTDAEINIIEETV